MASRHPTARGFWSLTAWLFVATSGCVPGGSGGGGDGDGGPMGDDACVPQCAEMACGSDGCGGECGQCAAEQLCSGAGQCIDVPASCGDAVCDPDGETCENCPADCGQCCGDGLCAAQHGEHCGTCPADCGCPEGETCDAARGVCGGACAPMCDGRACGPDGCGGVCGACAAGQICDGGGQCVEVPADCGDGSCGEGEDCANCAADCGCVDGVCQAGACVPVAQCEDACDAPGAVECTVDGFAYRLCSPDPDQPGCSTWTRRVPCADGRSCQGADTCEGACRMPEVMLLVDRSSSMAGERWGFTHPALIDVAERYRLTARLGLRSFPAAGDACAAGEIVAPAYEADPTFAAIAPPVDVAQTPLAAAFDGLEAAYGDPEDGQSVILITDGDETCQAEQAAVERAAALRRRGVRTFVIGIGQQANHELLSAIAAAGDTARGAGAGHYAVADAAGLRAALDDIFGRLEVCACAVGEQRCVEGGLQTCEADGGARGFGDPTPCPFGCDAEVDACFPFCNGDEGTIRCTGDTMTRCTARGEGFTVVRDCPRGCRDGVGCNEACRPGETRCAGDALEQCNAAGDGFEEADRCANGCDAEQAACHPVCRPGGFRCSGDDRQQCNADGDGYDRVEVCAFGCRAGQATCHPVCRPGETRCDGQSWTRCAATGDRYELIEQCAIACAPGEGCQSCKPFVDVRCGAAGIERCDAEGEAFAPAEACQCAPTAAVCLPGRFAPAPEGSLRFDSADLDASFGQVTIWDQRQSWSPIAYDVMNLVFVAQIACRQLGWPTAEAIRPVAYGGALWTTVFSCLGDEMGLMNCNTPNGLIDADAAVLTCERPAVGDAYCVTPTVSWWYQPGGIVRRETCLAGCNAASGRCRDAGGDPARCMGAWTVTDLSAAGGAGPWVADGDLTVRLERHVQFASCAPRATGSNDIYSFTAPVAGTYSFTTSGANGGDTILFVRSWCTVEGTEQGCNDDTLGRFSRVDVPLEAGERTFVFVDSYTAAERSTYRLTAERLP